MQNLIIKKNREGNLVDAHNIEGLAYLAYSGDVNRAFRRSE